MVRARQTPMEPPIATASKTHRNDANPHGSWQRKVVAAAIPMPITPNRLPCRAVSGEDRPRNARMKSIPETRYKRPAIFPFNIASAFFLEHGQHPLGDEEAAKDIDRSEGQGEETEHPGGA